MKNMLIKLILIIFLLPTVFFSQNFNDTTEAALWENIEWEIDNVNYKGNPFDLIAKVSFIHENSNEVKTAEMFYDENNTWKFRFTGTKLGIWKFFSSSSNKKLDNLKGIIKVLKNSNKKLNGFLTHRWNKFAIQTYEDSIKAFIFNIYMNETNPKYSFRYGNDVEIKEYVNEAKANGCSVIFSTIVANSWFNFPTLKTNEKIKKNPDPATFRRLEKMIFIAKSKGVLVHIWAWGDENNKLSQRYIGEGINGKEDRRLQRYIAARLGSIPGWTMGYGFDLHEWISREEIEKWSEFIEAHMDWKHLLSARGIKSSNPFLINSYDGFGREGILLATSSYGPHSYKEVLSHISKDKTKPHLYEERHTYKRRDTPQGKTNGTWELDMDGTRRLIWWEAMAGGMGGWFGYYQKNSNAYGGYPYSNPEQLATFRKFWIDTHHFLLDMIPDSTSQHTYILKSENTENTILYKENTNFIEYNFSNISNNIPIIAIDTKTNYKELNIEHSSIKNNRWNATYTSDWVIATGDFNSFNYHLKNTNRIFKYNNLNSFRISANNKIVTLNWQLTYDINLKGIAVESSNKKDSTDWKIIGFIQPNENDNTYSFGDTISNTNDIFNYRLKIFYKDNVISISNTLNSEKTDRNNSVNFNSFNIIRTNKGIKLEWETTKENNVITFLIERKLKDVEFWDKIGEIKSSQKKNNKTNKYNFVDTVNYKDNSFYYRIKAIYKNGSFVASDVISSNLDNLFFNLDQNYPNPFNLETTIKYTIPKAAIGLTGTAYLVQLKVYNILGEEITTLLNDVKMPGNYEVKFDASNLPSGIYIYQLNSVGNTQTKKMLLLK